MESSTIRKAAWRILPFVMLLYVVSFLDRVNIGFAALTMNADLGLSAAAFGLGAGIFFVGYVLFEVPSNLILYRVGARLWIARVMVSWGIVSGLTAFIHGAGGFYVLRLLLGVAEAGFFPGIILYLSQWFPARHRAAMVALFMAAAPLSTVVGSPLSAALLGLHGLGLKGWQWLFLAEALPAVLLGLMVPFVLTDRPEQARWLDAQERAWLAQRLADEERGSRRGLWHGVSDARVLALSLVYFGTAAGLYAAGIWSPLIIRQYGLTTLQVGFVNAGPSLVAVAAMLWWSARSDRLGERRWHVAIACLVAAAGFVWAGLAGGLLPALAALTLVNVGVSASKPPLWAMPGQFLAGPAAAAGIAVINALGNLGGLAGPAVIGWLRGVTGSFAGGLYFVAALLVLSAGLTLALSRRP